MKLNFLRRTLPALFFILLTVLGLLLNGYGLPCDEPAEQEILRENLKEYAIRLLGEDSSAALYYDALRVERASQSVERDHGQCVYYPAAPLLALLGDRPEVLTWFWHAYTWLWFMLGVISLYGFGRETGLSRPMAFLGSLLLYLSPRFFAEGHYNNKDVVLLSLVLCTLWLGARLLRKPGFMRSLLFSLVGAMAANIKIAGVYAWALFGVCEICALCANRAWNRRMLCIALTAVGAMLLFYVLLTPALWADPVGYLRYVIQNASGFTRWTGVVVFRGTVFDHAVNPLPRYYLPYMMLVSLPLYVFPLAALGQISALRRAARQKRAALTDPATLSLGASTLIWLIPLAFAALTRPLVYNGWRHFYFVFAGIAPLAARGLQSVSDYCKKRRMRIGRIALAALLGLCLTASAVGIALNHPYQYGYYNLLARDNAEADMELDYWDVSTVNAMKGLLNCERNTRLPLKLGARDDMSWFGVEHGYAVLAKNEREALTIAYDENAPYLFYNTTYARIYGVAPPVGYHALFAVESYGNTLCTVYEREADASAPSIGQTDAALHPSAP